MRKIDASRQTGHLASWDAAFRPWKSNTEAAEQAHSLQNRWPQPRAYGLNTISCKKKRAWIKFDIFSNFPPEGCDILTQTMEN